MTTTNTNATNESTQAVNLAAQVQSIKASEAAQTASKGLTEQTITRNEELARLGEKLGEFKAYDSQLPLADITGTRIIKCLYQKNPNTGTKAQENSYVRIPTKHLTEELILKEIASLTPHILTWLQNLEDVAIKDSHKNGLLNVFCDGLSLDSLVEKLEESNDGSRLNKEKVEKWFTDHLEEALAEKFLVKMGVDLELASDKDLAKLEQVLTAYKAKFASLASPKCFIQEADCVAMINVIKSCEAETSLLGSRFVTRLTKMQEKEEDLLLTL